MEEKDLFFLQKKISSLRVEGKYKETIETCYELLERAIEVNDYKSILTAHIGNAASFYCIGDIEEAFNSIELYSEVCTQYGDELDWINLYNILGVVYIHNKDFEKAKETIKKSI